jgi:hypothetical protein
MKTWVLILVRGMSNSMPAVIGGYNTEDEAVAAGEKAIAAKKAFERAQMTGDPKEWSPEWNRLAGAAASAAFNNYAVIPGAASIRSEF